MIKQVFTPMFLDGLIYVFLAIFAFMQIAIASDEAAKYIAPMAIFYFKFILGTTNAGLLATKMYRSTAFADHKQQKQKEFDTAFLIRQQTVNKTP